MHSQCHYSVQRTDNEMEGNPRDEKPARPVAAVKHKHSSDDLEDAGEMNVPVTFNITERCTAEQGDAAEDYEEPTDDCDREWPPVHRATDYTDPGRIY